MKYRGYDIEEEEYTYSYACDPNFTEYTTGAGTLFYITKGKRRLLPQFNTEEEAKKYIRNLIKSKKGVKP